MRRLVRLSAAAVLFVVGCRDGTGPDDLPQAPAGRFVAVVSGAESAQLEGTAAIASGLSDGREVWLTAGDGTLLAITPPVLGGSFDFRAGRHSFGVLGPVNAFFGRAGETAESYLAVGGTLRIRESDAAHITGEFEFTAEAARSRRQVQVRGNFHALPAGGP